MFITYGFDFSLQFSVICVKKLSYFSFGRFISFLFYYYYFCVSSFVFVPWVDWGWGASTVVSPWLIGIYFYFICLEETLCIASYLFDSLIQLLGFVCLLIELFGQSHFCYSGNFYIFGTNIMKRSSVFGIMINVNANFFLTSPSYSSETDMCGFGKSVI